MRVLDQTGYDLLEGLGANRDANATEQTNLVYASTSNHPIVDEADALTFVIDNHFAPSARIEAAIYYEALQV